MDVFDSEIQELWEKLYKNGVEYILVGGFATNLNGFSRMTADMDIWLKDTEANRMSFRKVLEEVTDLKLEFITGGELVAGWTTVKLKSGFDLDIMTSIKGLEQSRFDECYQLSPTAKITGVRIKFLHINYLIEAKRASGRPKDLIDIEELENIRKNF